MDLIEAAHGPTTRHPWEQARAAFFLRQLRAGLARRQGLGSDPVRALDIGCGDAWFAGRLAAELPVGSGVTGWDTGFDPATTARLAAGLPAAVTLTATEPAGRFDLIVAMDVIEHVADDRGLVGSLVADHLAPGGLVLVSVPAWPALFSRHDVALRHHRRYSPAMGRAVLHAAGLTIERQGGLFHGLALVRALQVARHGRARPQVAESEAAPAPDDGPIGLAGWDHSAAVTRLVTGILAAEGRGSALAARLGLSVPGLTWWALCRHT